MHFRKAGNGPEKAHFWPCANNWKSVLPEGQNYIWDVLDYLKCSFPHVLCEYLDKRNVFRDVWKGASRDMNNAKYMHSGMRPNTWDFPALREPMKHARTH